ncbi:hypothetical protein ISS05_01115 [Candidatus Woesearchaeota archaeon]|nr:hypothetical protein [Candidatus Woesearchaeota archaeon]
MNHDEEHWKKQTEKFSLAKICPKCGKLSLSYREDKLICSECDFEQTVAKVGK